ncbi:MAG TPA: 4Fe-4S dicluster domain-containing protein [Terriglobia bacterium]|nr:4Fe-4S dicluster domain-containing protein [Terriglobia bacterium]
MSKSILVDTTRCIGCGACATACKIVNNLPLDEPGAAKDLPAKALSEDALVTFAQSHGEVDGKLSADTLNVVQTHGSIFVRRFCMHCQEPTCASVCPVGALHKTAAGPVVYDAGKCMGCRYCMMACPFGVPRYEWKAVLPKVKKCTMCAVRQAKGQQPACTEVCPVQAGIFGERDDVLLEAEKRLREEPAKYFQRVYGKEEVGGTSVLYLSAVPFEQLGLPANLPRDPLPLLTFRVLSKIPYVVTLGGMLLGGIWWITNRREEVAKEESKESGH